MNKPKKLNDLIETIKLLPGIGSRNAERLAYSILDNKFTQRDLIESIKNIEFLKRCKMCHVIDDNEICAICANPGRKNMLCVVPTSRALFQIEELGIYKGYYHVLQGEINIQKGITPEKLNINDIKKRLENNNLEEIILALNLTIQGETTALYITEKNKDRKISRLAQGIPMGQSLEHVDAYTLEKAFNRRSK